jgi:hypothetical protein
MTTGESPASERIRVADVFRDKLANIDHALGASKPQLGGPFGVG